MQCPNCKIKQNHFNKEDFLICTNCGISFHWSQGEIVIDEMSYYGKLYQRKYYINKLFRANPETIQNIFSN